MKKIIFLLTKYKFYFIYCLMPGNLSEACRTFELTLANQIPVPFTAPSEVPVQGIGNPSSYLW